MFHSSITDPAELIQETGFERFDSFQPTGFDARGLEWI